MAARGHFVYPIDAKNHRVLVIRDLNGYGEYEFDRCICDKVSNFGDIIIMYHPVLVSKATGLLFLFNLIR